MLAFFIALTLMPVLLSFGKDGKPHPKVQELSLIHICVELLESFCEVAFQRGGARVAVRIADFSRQQLFRTGHTLSLIHS